MKQGLLYTIIFTFVICFVFVFLLSFVDERTKEKVQFNVELEQKLGILNAFGVSYSDQDDALQKYEENITVHEIEGESVYETSMDGNRTYAKQFAGSGLWGTIYGVIAVDSALTRIVGIEILSQNETPGLGGRIVEPWFKDQLRGETIVNEAVLVTSPQAGDPGDADKSNGSIDAITGATRTSDSIEVILAQELETLRSIVSGGNL